MGGTSYIVAAMFHAPGLLTGSLPVAAVVFVVAAAGGRRGEPPAGLGAARHDAFRAVGPGRGCSYRAALVTVSGRAGWLSTRFGALTSGLQHATGVSPHGKGLQRAFLVMLMPLVASSLIVLIRARETIQGEVATAIAPEQATRGVDA